MTQDKLWTVWLNRTLRPHDRPRSPPGPLPAAAEARIQTERAPFVPTCGVQRHSLLTGFSTESLLRENHRQLVDMH